jgi:DNA-binding beta-propeller fold protein YncE
MPLCESLESRRLLTAAPLPMVFGTAQFAAAVQAMTVHAKAVRPSATTNTAAAPVSAALPVQSLTVTSTAVGTSALKLHWNRVPGAAQYRITYTPGAYVPGPDGNPKTLTVGAMSTTARLTDLRPFTLYSVTVAAIPAGAASGAAPAASAAKVAWTNKPSTTHRYLYAVDLPKSRQGFQTLPDQIEVFDIDNGHKWVKNIPLPAGIYNARGVAASTVTGKLYVSFFDAFQDGYQPGGLLCMDMYTDAVFWIKHFDTSIVPSPDRFALTPDGAKIYMPGGENGGSDIWTVLDASNGEMITQLHHVTAPHNTNVSVDGRWVFLAGQEKAAENPAYTHTIAVVDTTTDTIVRRVGPFDHVARVYAVNGKASLIFAATNDLIGFQVADVNTGQILYTATPPGVKQPTPRNVAHSHGIAITPDERELYVVDTDHHGVHVFDISNVPAEPPKYIKFIQTRATGKDLSGNADPNASNDATGVPAWVVASYDGKYVYPESGEIIDVATHQIVGQLRWKKLNSQGQEVWGPYTHSRFIFEADFDGGKLVNVTNQFGDGRVR